LPEIDYSSKPSYYVLFVILGAGLLLVLLFATAPFTNPEVSAFRMMLCSYDEIGCIAGLVFPLYMAWGFGLFMAMKVVVDSVKDRYYNLWVIFVRVYDMAMLGPAIIGFPCTFFLNNTAKLLGKKNRFDAKEEVATGVGILLVLMGFGGWVGQVALAVLKLYVFPLIPVLIAISILIWGYLFLKK